MRLKMGYLGQTGKCYVGQTDDKVLLGIDRQWSATWDTDSAVLPGTDNGMSLGTDNEVSPGTDR